MVLKVIRAEIDLEAERPDREDEDDVRARRVGLPTTQERSAHEGRRVAEQNFAFGTTVSFDGPTCRTCPVRARCTNTKGRGRQVSIASDEALQQRLHQLIATPRGRERLRERVPVEHRLAHISSRQGPRARYRSVRKNTFDLRRVAAIQNLETAHRSNLEMQARRQRAAA